MEDRRAGVAPIASADILDFMLRALRRSDAFGTVLDPTLEDLAHALEPAMPSHLFPDVYLSQPLSSDAHPAAGFVLNTYERNYLWYLTDGAFFAGSAIPADTEPTNRARLCGLLSTQEGLTPLVLEDDSFESRQLTSERKEGLCAHLGIRPASTESHLLDTLASLPLRLFAPSAERRRQLVIVLPFSDPRGHFGTTPYHNKLVEALASVGVDRKRLEAFERICARQGIPCYSESLGFIHWLASTDVSHLTLSFDAGRVTSCTATMRISDRSVSSMRTVFRPLRSYQWHITDNCDQRCKHCYLFAEDARARCISTPFDQLLETLDAIEARCAQLHYTPSLAITGGDPILHPRFWDLAEELHRRGFIWSLMGNPFHLDDKTCQRLHLLGCARYQLSLDGLRTFHDSLRKPGSFDATLAAVRLLREEGLQVQLMATASRQNLHDILACMDLAVSLDVDCFVFARYCATSPDKAAELYPTPDEYRAFLLAYYEKRRAYAERGAHCEFKLKEHLFCLLRYELGEFEIPAWSLDRPDIVCDGCHLGGKATIASNGDLLACRRMESVVGNIAHDSLADVEEGPLMRSYRDVSAIKGCSDCKLLMWCRGCRAVGFNATGDLQAADPMCWHQVSAADDRHTPSA